MPLASEGWEGGANLNVFSLFTQIYKSLLRHLGHWLSNQCSRHLLISHYIAEYHNRI